MSAQIEGPPRLTLSVTSRPEERPFVPLRLNFDVLLVILSFVEDRPDIAKMMRTCRTLHRAGVPHVLYGEITVSKIMKFLSLCRFMVDKNPPRFRHLRHLTLGPWTGKPAVCNALPAAKDAVISFFQSAQYLESLVLRSSDDVFIDRPISQAICGLTSIRHFNMYHLDKNAYQMLCKFQSPLTSLDISFNYLATDPGDAIYVLRHFKDSLQELRVDWAVFETGDITYPHLTTIYTELCVVVNTGCLFRAYPNLQDFDLSMIDEELEDDSQDPHIESYRRASIRAQEMGTWETLQCLRGSLIDIYRLAVRSKVERLSLRPSRLQTSYAPRLQTILADNRPTALCLSIDTSNFDASRLGEFLLVAVDTLTALELDVHFDGEYYKDPSSTLKTLLASLSPFSIQLINMRLEWSYSRHSPMSSPPDSPRPCDPGRPTYPFSTLDAGPIAQEAMCAIPSLQNFVLDAGYPNEYHWEIGHDTPEAGGARRLVQLDIDDGWRLLERSLLHDI